MARHLASATNEPDGRYLGFTLACHERISPAGARLARRALEQQLVTAYTRVPDGGGIDLVLRVLVSGGVTETHLEDQLDCWTLEMQEFRKAVADACGLVDPRKFH